VSTLVGQRQYGTTIACEGRPELSQGKDDDSLLTTYKSSDWGERCFCSKCGTNLFANSPDFGYFGVNAGALELQDQTKLHLAEEIFIDKKPDFYSFAGDRKKLTEEEFLAMVSGGGNGGGEEDKGTTK
jgi:hypothetical protein